MSDEGFEKEYIKEAFDTNWIAPLGENVNNFENEMAEYVGATAAAALSSGTAAIHMAIKAAGVEKNDTVFCQALTFAATVNPVIYEDAVPVFIDSEKDTWNMNPTLLKKAFEKYPSAKAVIVVNLYGNPAKLDEIRNICDEHGATLIEDAAESLGSKYLNKETGTFGDYAAFSFNGNKIITTSGGGMIVSNNQEMINKIKFWSTQSRENMPYYHHKEIGYNYRLSNICAGIGRGQLKILNNRIEKKTKIYKRYKETLEKDGIISMISIPNSSVPNHWLSVGLINNQNITPEHIINKLQEKNIEARRVWKPMQLQPVFEKFDYIRDDEESVSEYLFNRGICLPSDTKMSEEEQEFVIDVITRDEV